MVVDISRIKDEISSLAKFHISLGQETVLGKMTLFTRQGGREEELLNFSQEFL